MRDVSDIERQIIGAILNDVNMLDLCRTRGITCFSFGDAKARKIYGIVEDISKAGKCPDVLEVGNHAPELLNDLMSEKYLCVSTANIDSWIKSVKEAEAERELLKLNSVISTVKESSDYSIAGQLDKIEAIMQSARNLIQGDNVKTLTEIAGQIVQNIDANFDKGIPWFCPHSEAGQAIHHNRGDMYVVCCRSGQGKTALTAGITVTNLTAGNNVLYVCTESSSADILARIVSAYDRIPHYIVNTPTDAKARQFAKDIAEFTSKYKNNLFVLGNDTGINTPAKIRGAAKKIIAEHGKIDLIVIDFFQNLKAPDFMARQTRKAQLDYCTDQLHAMFAELHSAGIVLAQLNRTEGSKLSPDLEHIKETGYVGELAHAVLFLVRDDKKKETLLYSRKERNMAHVQCELHWNGTGYESSQKYKKEF